MSRPPWSRSLRLPTPYVGEGSRELECRAEMRAVAVRRDAPVQVRRAAADQGQQDVVARTVAVARQGGSSIRRRAFALKPGPGNEVPVGRPILAVPAARMGRPTGLPS